MSHINAQKSMSCSDFGDPHHANDINRMNNFKYLPSCKVCLKQSSIYALQYYVTKSKPPSTDHEEETL